MNMVRFLTVDRQENRTEELKRPSLTRLPFHAFLVLSLLALTVAFCLTTDTQKAVAAPSIRPVTQSLGDPLVLAFYYTWYDQNTWTRDRLSDLPAQTYVSRDRSVMGRQIDEAKRAGIDAFLVAWYGPGGGNQTESNLAALLDEAAARNFKIGVLFETTSPFIHGAGDVTAALQHLQNVHANHSAYLHVDGHPVVFFWHPTLYSVATWRTIRAQTDPNHNDIWISEGVDTSYLSVFDGHHLYSNTWNPPADLNAVDQKFAGLVARASQTFGAVKLWVATVMPGYNDVRIRPGNGFARDRAGGNYYTQGWQAAIASHPNWIVVNSFNEWPEGTYIEPSVAFGDQYLTATAQWSQRFKAGGSAQVQAASFQFVQAILPTPTPSPPPPPTPPPDKPTAYVNVLLLNVRGAPNTDATIVAQAPQGAAMPITGSDPQAPDWWQVNYDGTVGWVYAPMVNTGGPMEQVPVLNTAAPVGSATPGTPPTPEQASAAATFTAPTARATPILDPQLAPITPYLSP